MDLTRFRQETEVIRHSSRTRLGKVALTLLIAALLTIFLLFITLPVVSLFLRISPEAFFRSLSEPVIL